MVFNAIVGNDDDHPRNHALVFQASEKRWRLSPLFDVVPNPDETPKRLAMQLCAGRFDISRETILADTEKFGLPPTEAIQTLDDFLKALGSETDKHLNILDEGQVVQMASRIKKQLQLLTPA